MFTISHLAILDFFCHCDAHFLLLEILQGSPFLFLTTRNDLVLSANVSTGARTDLSETLLLLAFTSSLICIPFLLPTRLYSLLLVLWPVASPQGDSLCINVMISYESLDEGLYIRHVLYQKPFANLSKQCLLGHSPAHWLCWLMGFAVQQHVDTIYFPVLFHGQKSNKESNIYGVSCTLLPCHFITRVCI